MTWFLTIGLLIIGIILLVSLIRWNVIRALRKSLTLSDYDIYDNKRVTAIAKRKTGDTFGFPLKCTVAIGQRDIHVIPLRFNPFLFMTDYPIAFSKATNKKLKIQRSEYTEIIFIGKQRKSSVFGSVVEITIQVYDQEEKKELVRKLKNWK
ncbi:hypothetical protein O3Q51_09375 [Cryomorphaceae bacterium 1068]|nr:hypothetical protein [Cryomorphaceae bacterium 1068]